MKLKVYKRKVVTRHELLALILDAAARMKKREDQLRLTTHHLHTEDAECSEVDGGILESSLYTGSISFLPCNKSLFSTSN